MDTRGVEGDADLVTALVDDLQDVCGQRILLPVSDGVGNLASLRGDAVVLPEDSPVSVGHLIQLLLRPVSVVPALLGLLLAHLLQSCPERRDGQRVHLSQTNLSLALEKKTWSHHSLLLLLLLHGSPVLHQVTVETGLLSLLLL